MTILNSIIKNYIALTNYYIVNNTFTQQVITAMRVQKQKNGVKKMTILNFNTLRNYTTIYHTYQLLFGKNTFT